jgi:hypothetical protein
MVCHRLYERLRKVLCYMVDLGNGVGECHWRGGGVAANLIPMKLYVLPCVV